MSREMSLRFKTFFTIFLPSFSQSQLVLFKLFLMSKVDFGVIWYFQSYFLKIGYQRGLGLYHFNFLIVYLNLRINLWNHPPIAQYILN